MAKEEQATKVGVLRECDGTLHAGHSQAEVL